jgi:hypothetical protein
MSTKNSNGCAFLKTKGTRDVMLSNGDWVVMTTQASGGGGGYGGGGSSGGGSSGGNSGSTGNPGCAKFVGNGEKCTTNPWAAEQICESKGLLGLGVIWDLAWEQAQHHMLQGMHARWACAQLPLQRTASMAAGSWLQWLRVDLERAWLCGLPAASCWH